MLHQIKLHFFFVNRAAISEDKKEGWLCSEDQSIQVKGLLIVKQLFPTCITGNLQRTVGRICIMLDKVSRVNPFVPMKGGPDPSPSQG